MHEFLPLLRCLYLPQAFVARQYRQMSLTLQSNQYAHWTKLFLKSNLSWPLYLVLGLVLLPGRFEWSSQTRTANWRGFDCSAFFLCLLIPLVSTILERLEIRRLWRHGALAGVTLLLSLPYHWLGLDHWFYHRNKLRWIDWKSLPQPPKLVWFPQAFREPPQIPHESLFFGLLTLILFAGGWWYLRARRLDGKPIARSTVALGAVAILLVLAQTWMHLSIRSPYTYICHFERPPEANYWFESLLFPNGQGAVNADYRVFRGLEEVFMGNPEPINGLLIRRPFPFYISSQFSYFVNPYYVMVFFNVLLWLSAVLAIRDYVAAHFDGYAAAIAALLTASGPGFIMYVAQPQTYLWGYCAVALTVWAHWRICGSPNAKLRDYAFFGGVLSLAFLTYDLLTLLLYFVGYELLFKKSMRRITVSAALSIGIYIAFGLLTAHMKSFVHDTNNIKDIGRSLTNALAILQTSPVAVKSYVLYTGLLPNYVLNLGNAVFVFPLLLAVFGLFSLNNSLNLKLVGLLFLPSLGSVIFLYLGQTYLSILPRFAFTAYPAVYILCGVALCGIARAVGARWRYAAMAVALVAVTAHVMLVNADVFGHPWLYYLFYYEQWAPPRYF
jgi:hypothetical protein